MMTLEYDENKKPVLKMSDKDVTITISFSDAPKNKELKQTIVELLTSAYEDKVIGARI